MTTVLCTLYNCLYLDKGLVLYDSLRECAKDFKLYVLCMDDKCYEVLTNLKQENQIPVRLSDFEAGDDALLKAKGNRSMGEYCWTCSSSFIRYILNHYNEESCTYIDADMYFYYEPQILVDEMKRAGKSVMVVPHRFPECKKVLAQKYGTYCVEFNTFLNTPESLEVLEYWRSRCLECCSNLGDGVHWGDQKYLEELVSKFKCVHVCKNPGAGVAPWNISLYRFPTRNKFEYNAFYKPLELCYPVVFYHYQGVKYITRNKVISSIQANMEDIDYEFVDYLYKDYLVRIDKKKLILESRYNLKILIKKHPSKKTSCLKSKLQNTFLYRSLSKLYQMRKSELPYIVCFE